MLTYSRVSHGFQELCDVLNLIFRAIRARAGVKFILKQTVIFI